MFYYSMDKISFKNNVIPNQTTQTPEIQQRMQSQENFGAIDKEKLKQDTVELANKTKEGAKENFVFRIMRKMGSEDPKKTLKSIILTLGTVVGLAVLGNKMSNKTASWGLKVDEVVSNSNWYKKLSGALSGAKNKITGFFKKSKTVSDVANTLTNEATKAKPKADMCRGYGRGFVSIFSLTPVDILKKGFKDTDSAEKALKKIVGDDKAKTFAAQLFATEKGKGIADNRKFCLELSNAIREKFDCVNDNKKFLDILKEMQTGKIGDVDVSEFKDVIMKEKGFMGTIGSWWPVNIIEKVGKIFKKDFKFCRGNLGDSLVKYNAVNGTLAKTGLGKLTQKMITVPTESISNFVNDKSGLGVFLCSSIIAMYNSMQDAPKGKKAGVVADDFVGTIGSIAIATPLAFKTTYGLASLANLEGKTFGSKILKGIGKFFNMGLKDGAGKLARFGGGALRFGLIMFVFSSMFRKPIDKVVHKIFGKPYNKAEEEQKKAQEAQMNQIIPELGVSQAQLMEKIQKNPAAIERLQSDPQLLAKAQQNPKIIIDLLDGTYNENAQNTPVVSPTTPKAPQLSPANRALLNGTSTINKTPSPTNNQPQQKIQDTVTYIPSSDFIAKDEYMSAEQSNEINSALARADKVLAQAEKYI